MAKKSKEYLAFQEAVERMQATNMASQELLAAFNRLKAEAEAFEDRPHDMFYTKLSKPSMRGMSKGEAIEAKAAYEEALKSNAQKPKKGSHLFILKDFTQLANEIADRGMPSPEKLEKFCRRHEQRYHINTSLRTAATIALALLVLAAASAVIYLGIHVIGLGLAGVVGATSLSILFAGKPLVGSITASLMLGSLFSAATVGVRQATGHAKQVERDIIKNDAALYSNGVEKVMTALRK